MANITREKVLDALRTVEDPDLHRDLVSLGMIRDLEVDDAGRTSLRVVLTTPACPLKDKIRGDVEAALRGVGVTELAVQMDAEVPRSTHPHSEGAGRLPDVRAIIAVGSGKGGVGKSTVAANLAISLARQGARVGLIDADIYGPSMPVMLGLTDVRPTATADGKKIIPIEVYGIQVMSMGFMLEADQAVIWRGPMLGRALQQFIEDVAWGDLDYVVVDMPPGTGDVALSLAQLLPVSGAIVVTTPQDVAFADVRRAIKLFETTRTPVLGIVENMSHFVCDQCDKQHEIFGESRVEDHARRHDIEVLGQLPLDSVTAVAADRGEPIIIAAPDSPAARSYEALASRVAQKLAVKASTKASASERFKSFFQVQRDA